MIVEAAETLFTPACVYNNTKDDDDARVRDSFAEPAWNNPVVRIVDADRNELAPRVHDQWTVPALARAMVTALRARERAVPAWLELLTAERTVGTDVAVFGMG